MVGLLRSTRVTRLHRYYEPVRPSASHRYSAPHGSTTWSSPFASRQEVPTFRTRACAGLTPPSCRSPLGQSSRLPPSFVPGQQLEPGFDDVPTLSTRHQRFTHVRLPSAHLTGSSRLFPNRSPPRPLGQRSIRWFGPRSCSPSPRGLPSSLVQQGCFRRPSSRPPFRAVVAHSHRRSARRRVRVSPVPCRLRRGAHSRVAARGGRPAASPRAAPPRPRAP